MTSDLIAVAFAKWLEAHKKHVDAEKRLAQAQAVCRKMGTLPPNELAEEVRALKAEADARLQEAQRLMNGG